MFSPAVHHPHRNGAGGGRKGHDSLLAENHRRAGRVPARVLAALLVVEPHCIRGKCRPVCVGMTWRRLITAGAMLQWRPRLEEVNREVRQFGVAVPGGVEHVGLRAKTGSFSQTVPTPSIPSKGRRSSQRRPTACQHLRCLWLSATAQDPLTSFFEWTPGRPGRLTALAESNRGTPWGRQCSVWRYDQG